MIAFPINPTTFKKSFLDGNGTFDFAADPGSWAVLVAENKPFTRETEDLVRLKFGAGTSKDFEFGTADKLALSVGLSAGAGATIELVWPGQHNDAVDAYGLDALLVDGTLYVIAHFDAKADASAKGAYPVGPLSTTFGVAAGGSVGYDRLVLCDATTSAKVILSDLFAEMRLPHAAAAGDVPRVGEVLALQYGGYLKLSAGLTWGYSLTMAESFEIADLNLALDYGLKAMAAVTLGYQLAGSFDVTARRGTRGADWVRFQVRKSRESEIAFAADFGFEANADLDGLPASADDFLSALLGTNAKTILSYFARAEEFTSVDALEQKVGALATTFLGDLADKWLGKALDDSTIKQFFAVAQQVADAYKTIDQRIIDMYGEYLDRIPELESVLDRFDSIDDPSQIKGLPPEVLDLLRRLWGGTFLDLVFGARPISELEAFVRRFRSFLADQGAAHIRDFVAAVKTELGLDPIFDRIDQLDTPEKLEGVADAKLQEIIGKLIGRAFAELRSIADFTNALAAVRSTLGKIDEFKQTWFEKVTALVHQKFTFDLHYAFARADTTRTLLDVEVNVSTPAGRALAAKAASGDFAETLALYDPALVLINEATLTHELTRSTQVQIDVLGRSLSSLVQVVQDVAHSIEVEPGGLMHVYTIDSYVKQRRETTSRDKMKESLESNFLLAAVGKTFQPNGHPGSDADPVLRTLANMSVAYDLAQHDDRTTVTEMTQILVFAEHLGLVSSAASAVEEFEREFPDGFGAVTASYVVRYDDRGVRSAFTLSGAELTQCARTTARGLVAAKFTALPITDERSTIGFAYLDPVFFELYTQGFTVLLNTKQPVVLPSWFTKGPPKRVVLTPEQRARLLTLFNVEKSYVGRLNALDVLVDTASGGTAIDVSDLAEAARDFVSMASELDSFGRVNTFFSIFDSLVREGSSGKGRRQTALILEITPPGGGTVTKYLMA